MKLFLLSALLASAAAFQASPVARQQSTALNVDSLDPSIGVTAPLGLYDPLGWLDPSKDPASKYATFHANFERRRAVERKHGRVAMAAVVGMLFHNAGIEVRVWLFRKEEGGGDARALVSSPRAAPRSLHSTNLTVDSPPPPSPSYPCPLPSSLAT